MRRHHGVRWSGYRCNFGGYKRFGFLCPILDSWLFYILWDTGCRCPILDNRLVITYCAFANAQHLGSFSCR